MKNTLSLTLIVKNEAHHLPQALRYAHIFADEIIIIDTGSTDNTKEIARKYTEKVYDYKWINDFSAARNFGISKCTKDFVIWLDADDYMTRSVALKIKSLMSGIIEWDYYLIPYHYTYGKYGNSRLIFYRERIFRNKKGIKFQYPIHECIDVPTDAKVVYDNKIQIFHKTLKRWENNTRRNKAILLKSLKTKEYISNYRFWWLLGREYAAEQNNTKSIKISLKSISLLPDSHGKQRSQQLMEIAVLYTREKEYENALEYAVRSIGAYNLWREPYFEAGRALWYLGRFDEALQMFLSCTHIHQPSDDSSFDMGIYGGPLLHDWLGLTYDRLDDYDNAIKHVKKALRYTPNDKRLKSLSLYWQEKLIESRRLKD